MIHRGIKQAAIIRAEAAEVAQLHNAAFARIQTGQRTQRIIQGDQVGGTSLGQVSRVCERNMLDAIRAMPPGEAYQHAPLQTHGLLPGQEAGLVETLTKIVASSGSAIASLRGGSAAAK